MNVERDTQKKILIGHKGEMLKKIGTEARRELEEIFGVKVYLGLYVKVAPDWRENPQKGRGVDGHFQREGVAGGQKEEDPQSGGGRLERFYFLSRRVGRVPRRARV